MTATRPNSLSPYRTAGFVAWKVSTRSSQARIRTREIQALADEGDAFWASLDDLLKAARARARTDQLRRTLSQLRVFAAEAAEDRARADACWVRAHEVSEMADPRWDEGAYHRAAKEHHPAFEAAERCEQRHRQATRALAVLADGGHKLLTRMKVSAAFEAQAATLQLRAAALARTLPGAFEDDDRPHCPECETRYPVPSYLHDHARPVPVWQCSRCEFEWPIAYVPTSA